MKTHCKHGHPWIKENLYTKPQGYTTCRICNSISRKKRKKKKLWEESYYGAMSRCTNKSQKKYPRYGGRGIKFLMTIKDFEFLWFRDNAPNMKCPTIDRIDNDGNYELSNCRFIERSENSKKDICGEKNYNSKLTENQVKKIRELFKVGIRQCVLAKQFRVSRHLVWGIIHNKAWKHV